MTVKTLLNRTIICWRSK